MQDPNLSNTSRFKEFQNRTNVVYIAGLFYWELKANCIERLEQFCSPFTLFMSIPAHEFGHSKGAAAVFHQRNDWIRKNGLYLPLAEMAAAGVFQRDAEDDMHFQCSAPAGPLDVKRGGLVFKAPRNKDCRDMVNLNLVMLLTHFVSRMSLLRDTFKQEKVYE